MAKVRQCKDCLVDIKRGRMAPSLQRPAPNPGPRCATHHRAHVKAYKQRSHELMVTKNYGIQPGEYDIRYKAQGGTCAICQTATGSSKRLAVDHNHTTGSVRGLLCGPCNRFVGRLRDSPDAFLRAHKYLRGELEYEQTIAR